MKKVFLPLILLINVLICLAQVPQAINYQGVARDAAGNVLANRAISMRLTVNEGISPGFPEYRETHIAQTNQFGLYTIKIGLGTPVLGNFQSVNWSTGNKY